MIPTRRSVHLLMLLSIGALTPASAQLVTGRAVLVGGDGAADVFVDFEEDATGRRFGTVTGAQGHYALMLDGPVTAITGDNAEPQRASLGQNYPNPFNPSTTIDFALPVAGRASLDVYNVLGQPVKRLVDSWLDAGRHQTRWDGTDERGLGVGAGVYVYRLVTEGETRTGKMLLIDGAIGRTGTASPAALRPRQAGGRRFKVSVYGRTIESWERQFTVRADTIVDLTGILPVPALAFVGVDVVPMDDEHLLPAQTVLIRAGRIEAIGPTADVVVPDDAIVVDGTGRFLAPGLMDMHVHLALLPTHPHRDLDLLLAHGVTTVRHMWGNERVLAQRGAIDSGKVVGPSVFTAAPGLDGSGAGRVSTPAEASAAVRAAARAGYDFIEVWGQLGPAEFDAAMTAAAAEGLPVIGQIPSAVGYQRALDAGMASVEHLYEFGRHATSRGADVFSGVLDTAQAIAMARAYGAAGAVVTPLQRAGARTGDQIEEEQRQDVWEFIPWPQREDWMRASASVIPHNERVSGQRAFVLEALDAAGARLMAGSAAGNGFFLYGHALWEELEEMAQGVTPYRALQAATTTPAMFLGVDDHLGRVEEGYLADLVLLDENPLEDITAVRSLVGTVVHGRWIPRRQILDRLAAERADELSQQPRNDCGEPFASHHTPQLSFSLRQTTATTNAEMVYNRDHYERRTHPMPGGELRYRLFTPDLETAESLPLVLYLHGGSGRGTGNFNNIYYGNAPIPYLLANPDMQARHPAFVVAPQVAENEWFDSVDPVALSPTTQAIVDLLDSLQREFPIDPARLYVLGSSLGGAGTWAMITKAPDLFAAAVPMSQAARWTRLPQLDAERQQAVRTLRDRGTQIWYFYGTLEGNGSLKLWWEEMKRLMALEGLQPRHTEYYDTGHGVIPVRAFATDDPIDWMYSKCHPRR